MVTGAADEDDDVVTITCPATSEGCTILDVIIFNNDGGNALIIDDAEVSAIALTGDPSFDIFTDDVTIDAGSNAQYLAQVSGVSLAAGDTLVITPTAGSGSTDWEVQVMADIEGGVADLGIDVS